MLTTFRLRRNWDGQVVFDVVIQNGLKHIGGMDQGILNVVALGDCLGEVREGYQEEFSIGLETCGVSRGASYLIPNCFSIA